MINIFNLLIINTVSGMLSKQNPAVWQVFCSFRGSNPTHDRQMEMDVGAPADHTLIWIIRAC